MAPIAHLVSAFLSTKLREHDTALSYFRSCQKSCREELLRGDIRPSVYHERMSRLDHKYGPLMHEAHVLRNRIRVISQDMEDECRSWWVANCKQSRASLQQSEHGPHGQSLREERLAKEPIMVSTAYDDVMRCELVAPQSDFDQAVLEYHSAIRRSEDDKGNEVYCPLTGWQPQNETSVAHLMPVDPLWNKRYAHHFAPLFGVDEVVFLNRKNGMNGRSFRCFGSYSSGRPH